MVTFWIAAAALTLGVGALLLRPLLDKTSDRSEVTNPDIEIYKSQLTELDHDEAAGAIGAAEAKSAKTEISRRLLAASEEDQASSTGLSSKQRAAILFLVCLIMPSLAATVYMHGGSPQYAAQPYTDKNGEAELWRQYARAYMQTERFDDAEGALLQAIELSDPRADLYEGLGEVIIFGGDGSISQRAIDAFNTALELDPTRERSRYILAEWMWRQGDREDAVRAFIDLLESTQDQDFQGFLKGRIEETIAEIKAELSGEPVAQRPDSRPVNPARPIAGGGALTGMSDDQRTMVLQMVTGLANRLEEDPDDLEGWLRLIRSYTVLQEVQKADEALQKATLQFLTRPDALTALIALAEELGLTSGPVLPEGAEGLEFPE